MIKLKRQIQLIMETQLKHIIMLMALK